MQFCLIRLGLQFFVLGVKRRELLYLVLEILDLLLVGIGALGGLVIGSLKIGFTCGSNVFETWMRIEAEA